MTCLVVARHTSGERLAAALLASAEAVVEVSASRPLTAWMKALAAAGSPPGLSVLQA